MSTEIAVERWARKAYARNGHVGYETEYVRWSIAGVCSGTKTLREAKAMAKEVFGPDLKFVIHRNEAR